MDDTVKKRGRKPKVKEQEATGLTISIPIDKVAVGNLTSLLEAKGELIKKALGIEETVINVEGDTVSFPWFATLPTTDEVNAYTHFISAICKLTKEHKQTRSVKKEIENEKYTFRCFLLRLGFIGPEYKEERKILLRNLTGSAAFKSGVKKKETNDEISE